MNSLFLAGIIVFIGAMILLGSNYDNINVDRNGRIVKMRIESLPSSCIGTKLRYFITFSYNGENYDKATSGNYCEKHHVGEMVDIKWLKGSKHILWPNESATTNLVSFGLLGILGLLISALQWRKLRNSRQM